MIFNLLNRHILVLLLTVLVIPNVKAETKDQHIKVALRNIGHEFLLQINDSTSRVLPVEKIDGRYAVRFKREFSFEPDLLLFAVFKVLEERKIIESYIVEVETCETKELVHSFEASLNIDGNMIACSQRALPKSCYVFYFTLIENNKNTYAEERIKSSGLNYIYVIIALIIVICVIFYRSIRNRSAKLNPDLINIGQYQFDKKGMILTLKAQSIGLSSKESDLLFLLFSNENKTLEREYILNIVWGDEGDYVGRTLDVFISKLRKKLEADSSLKIINVRGVGYRFVMN
ncbi:winged helix-turn-helix domain-containing protein [Ichthyenterobacterium magnum]|uniref:Transcriptional regulator n=1 Tax=Ichthyenterobacterium magnum TaxID=1230530 RepID=A0A420DL59_9FLAO|nr:response regulator transcription factor [Ichthyenterobacterium magnum]RKE94972.1 transcriptional regulator [Ichthyenterobacterium magnum]